MIRDGKKSINIELTRFLDFIDGVTVKRSGFVRKNSRQGESSMKSRGLHNNNKKIEDLVNRIEALYNKVPQAQQEDTKEDEEVESPRISLNGKNGVIQSRKGGFGKGEIDGIQVKAKKNVKFSEDGNVYYVPRSRNELVLVEECDGDDINDLLNAKKKLDFMRREAEEVSKDSEGDEVAQSDDGDDQESTKSSNDDGDDERGPTYLAPLPVRMETRSDLMDKRKTSKLVE